MSGPPGAVDAHSPGWHAIPPVFSSPRPTRRRRRPSARIVWSVLGGAAIIAAGVITQLVADQGYDEALVAFSDQEITTANRQSDLSAEIDALLLESETASAIAEADSGALMPADSRSGLDSSLESITATAESAQSVASEALPDAGEKPGWAWELFGEASRLRGDTAALEETAEDVDAQRQAVSEHGTRLETASVDAVLAAAAASDDFEAAHVNARNPEILALRRTSEYVTSTVTALDADALARFTELESAAAAVLETERAELEEKAGALHDARVEIEEFARGLAPGVLLDFDWSRTVPGYDGPSYGGWTTWWYGDPGYSTIALSDYIAEEWPAAWTKALVAHEVGHAISVKCASLYDSSDQDTIEEWATAWAVSMGYTDRNNGTAVYGAPSPSMIDAASKCR